MFSVITGKQRAGKSLYAVSEIIIEYLKTTKRPIVTSLPINPDYIVRYISKDPKKRREYMKRIYLFADTNIVPLRYVAKKNPLYWDYCYYNSFKKKSTLKDDSSEYIERKDSNIIDIKHVKEFWKHVPMNSVIVFDEAYESFSSMDAMDRTEENKERRKELLSMCRQHGHYKLDIFMISHSYQDLDAFLKRGIQYLYVVRNSKYSNIFDNKFFRGLKWPVQFFTVEGYEYGESKACDRWVIRPPSYLFKCYNSFSHSFKLGFHKTTEEQESTDIGNNYMYGFKRFFAQFWIWLIIGLGVLVGGGVLLKTIWKMAGQTNRDVDIGLAMQGNNEKQVKLKDKVDDKSKKVDTQGRDVVEKSPKITLLSRRQINYSDGIKIKIGGIYEGFNVVDINSNFVVLSDSDGKKFNVAISGLRK